jgi:hypothetical protein
MRRNYRKRDCCYSGRIVRLSLAGPNWRTNGNYYIIVNNVADSRGNLIAPNSVIPVPFQSGVVPSNGPPDQLQLTITRTNNGLRVEWPKTEPNIYYGYFLEAATNLEHPGSGVWQVVSNQANPLFLRADSSARLFRLRQGPNTGR